MFAYGYLRIENEFVLAGNKERNVPRELPNQIRVIIWRYMCLFNYDRIIVTVMSYVCIVYSEPSAKPVRFQIFVIDLGHCTNHIQNQLSILLFEKYLLLVLHKYTPILSMWLKTAGAMAWFRHVPRGLRCSRKLGVHGYVTDWQVFFHFSNLLSGKEV